MALAASQGGHLPAWETQESGGDGTAGTVGAAGTAGDALPSCALGPAAAFGGRKTVLSFTPSFSLGKRC